MKPMSIPYGAYWSTPFTRWQGAMAHLHSLRFAAHVAKDALARRSIPIDVFDHGVLGFSVPQQSSFYGFPWVAALMGAPHLPGATVAQACATSVRCLYSAATELALGHASCSLVLTADRTSNGPQVYYPDPMGPGGNGTHEQWVLDNFQCDPYAQLPMLETAERVAHRHGIDTARQHEVVLQRYAQYQEALADDSAFLRRFMDLPFAVPDRSFRKTLSVLDGDQGIHDTNAQALSTMKPVRPNGTVTYAAQTHPADGNAGMVVTTPDLAREYSKDRSICIELLSFGQARVEAGYMPEAPVPAAEQALQRSGLRIQDIDAIKTHNPFVINDIVLADYFKWPTERFNRFGSSLVWGHPQGPTGLRGVIELIEELVMRGGGTGLFTGCAAGDTGLAVVLKVSEGH